MKSKKYQDLLTKATDWRTLMIFGVAIAVVISFSRYCDILHVGALQAYILFPLSFFILSQLIYKKQMWRNKDMGLAAAVFLWTVVSLLINSDIVETPLLSGDYQQLCVSLFLCYPLAGALEPEQRKKVFRLLAAINVIGVTLLCCFALYCVIFGITPEVPFACESPFRIDYYDGRLYLFTNANGAGIYCQAAALLCVYLMLPKQAVWKRVLESAALLCIVCTLAITDSRTAILAFAAGIGMLCYLLIARAPRRNKKRSARVPFALVCALVTVVLCIAIVTGAKKGVGAVRTRVQTNQVAAVAEIQPDTPAKAPSVPLAAPKSRKALVKDELIPLSERPFTTKLFTLTDRTTIWAAILTVLPAHPDVLLYGTSTYADYETFENDFPILDSTRASGFHNSFLSVLVCYGIPGLVVWLAFLVPIYVCGIRVFFASPDAVDLQTAFLMSLLVSGFLVGMMESVLFVDGLPQASHTWLMLTGGMAVTTGRKREKAQSD